MPMCTVENNDYTERMLYNYYTHCTCTIIRLHVYSSIGYARMYPCTHHTSVKCLSNITRSALLRRLIHNLFDLCTLDYCNAHKTVFTHYISVNVLFCIQCAQASEPTGLPAARYHPQIRFVDRRRAVAWSDGRPTPACRPTTQGLI